MNNTCSSCRWFVPDPYITDYDLEDAAEKGWTSYGIGWGTCDMANSDSGRPDADRGDRETHMTTLALAVDASSYSASLSVSPDFGCIQWQEQA